MFINTTVHPIRIKLDDESILTVPPTEDVEVYNFFRCIFTSTPIPNMTYGDRTIARTGPAKYVLDEKVCSEFFAKTNWDEKRIYLVSTIAAAAWQECTIDAPKNFHVMVPYSGPDTKLCRRGKENIEWTALLIDYTNKYELPLQ